MSSADLALLNACLNATAALAMIVGYAAVRARRILLHRAAMGAAFGLSCLFLVSYVTRYAMYGNTPFGGEGLVRGLYFALLVSHVLLAMAVPPLAIRTIGLGLKGRIDAHRRLARVTFPIWMYVSVTGVLVYLMLHVWFPHAT
ncbi:MAG: DUF420 domain-containing protein [Myxococcota bacterium]|nr:DUF420 domain-containing protein [Myxococcota bacterium]MDW8363387.1 DUF420 domain-containing protein [Myxococcales bacterium]